MNLAIEDKRDECCGRHEYLGKHDSYLTQETTGNGLPSDQNMSTSFWIIFSLALDLVPACQAGMHISYEQVVRHSRNQGPGHVSANLNEKAGANHAG